MASRFFFSGTLSASPVPLRGAPARATASGTLQTAIRLVEAPAAPIDDTDHVWGSAGGGASFMVPPDGEVRIVTFAGGGGSGASASSVTRSVAPRSPGWDAIPHPDLFDLSPAPAPRRRRRPPPRPVAPPPPEPIPDVLAFPAEPADDGLLDELCAIGTAICAVAAGALAGIAGPDLAASALLAWAILVPFAISIEGDPG
jgi:hypothetical protein